MKICITSTGSDLDSVIDPRFGRCQFLLVVDEKGKLIKSIQNQASQAMRGAGIAAAQVVANEGVKIVISGNVGPNAFLVLNQVGIKVYLGVFDMTSRKALEMFNQGKLILTKAPLSPGFGPSKGGFGGQGGRGRGRRGRR